MGRNPGTSSRRPGRRAGEAAAPGGAPSWREWVLVLGAFGLITLLGLVSLSTAGSHCDRLLAEVGSTMTPVASGPFPAGARSWISPGGREGPPRPLAAPSGGEAYDRIDENPFVRVQEGRPSTFAVDVDTAAYANVRRWLRAGSRPPADAVRIEEMVNYFPYHDPEPSDGAPFAARVEVAGCPWAPSHRLARIGLQGRRIPEDQRRPANLVFLLDVSGSMSAPVKLPLLKAGLSMLVRNLSRRDRVAVVVYAGASGVVLPSTRCDQRHAILEALEQLSARGSTNAGSGIQLAYQEATRNFVPGGVNRVILATDGDFNVGVTNRGELTRLIEEKARTGVFLTVLGLGMGNLKDATLEELSRRGNGNYAYLDTLEEARKVLVRELGATLVTIAKDVKVQVEFDPRAVGAYRLIGYENRLLRPEDFRDDRKDAGEIGAGHTVTALYELIPPVVGAREAPTRAARDADVLRVRLRYKEPDGQTSKLVQVAARDHGAGFAQASEDFRFAASVAAFGMLLRGSPHRGGASYEGVLEMARQARGDDPQGLRAEFLELVELAELARSR